MRKKIRFATTFATTKNSNFHSDNQISKNKIQRQNRKILIYNFA